MKKIILILLLGSFLLINCERKMESTPTRSLPESGSAPTNLEMSVGNEYLYLTWEIDNPDDVNYYKVYISEDDTLNFKLHNTTTLPRYTFSLLNINSTYYFKVSAYYHNALESVPSEIISARFGILSMTISNDNEYTRSRSVQVQFVIPTSASHVKISEDPTLSDATFVTYAGTRNFTLSDGDGVKTVYASIQFTDGSVSDGILSDDIILDTRARIDSVFFNPADSVFAPGDTIYFGLVAGETGGTASVKTTSVGTVKLYDDGTESDDIPDDGVYHGWYRVPNNMNLTDAVVSGDFIDQAGNNAASLTSFQKLNINTPPDSVDLFVTFETGNPANFNWTSSTESDFESYRLYRADNPNVSTNDVLIKYEASKSATAFEYTPPAGITYYRLFVFDRHGASAGSNTVTISN